MSDIVERLPSANDDDDLSSIRHHVARARARYDKVPANGGEPLVAWSMKHAEDLLTECEELLRRLDEVTP